MKFRFISTQTVEADSLEEAKDKFPDSSWNFAANAECYGIKCPECGTFENKITAITLIDRITYNAHILDMNGPSYRNKKTMKNMKNE